ncbi:protein of unknown function DUF6 transmembrane [Denitrovibrio acetiphilus DSM 12809]|uniref:EamA domain-containing protein n=1 Tax=Denitrovibrio acetiphilus (strain DSM 12809 / NBRC 114555 / N2460) TaxID=522772 RepID=D4H5H3_DENA2|nr:DMT family transporter [Denitrovibrio acetiphilus]ADD67593.1 protein of unknown function DUF6 transmembrane [Denitrovibrio acetiphilus DSM 12809]
MPEKSAKGVVLHLLIGAFLISFSPVFVKLSTTAGTTSGFYRMFFGLLGLSALFFFGGKLQRTSLKGFMVITICGLFFYLDIYFWHISILYVGAGLSTLLANFQVFFMAGLDILVFKQKLSKRLGVAILMAVIGLYLLVGTGWGDKDDAFRMGVFFGLLTAMAYSGYLFTLRLAGSLTEPVDKRMSMLIVCLVGTVALGVTALISGESLAIPDVETGVYLVSYGVLSQAVGWVMIAAALPRTRLTIGGLVLLLQPTLAYVWDVAFFDKVIANTDLLGAGLAIFAIYLGTIRPAGRR